MTEYPEIKNDKWYYDAKIWFVLLIIYTGILSFLLRNSIGMDLGTYMGYLEGWKQGHYTYWYDIKEYIPDTFRNPGFPAVIGLLCLISKNLIWLQAIQFIFYAATLFLIIKIIAQEAAGRLAIPVFGLLVLLNPTIPYYIVQIVPEMLTGFLLSAILYGRLKWENTWIKFVTIGLLFGFLFQVRPVVLFLPFILFGVDWMMEKKKFPFLKNVALLAVYLVSMLPYGYWNYKTHGIFSVTSLEGGGGAMQLGYWSLKMPDYTENRYWLNGSYRGLISFADASEVPGNISAFNREWDIIDSTCAQYLTEKDLRNLPYMRAHGDRFVTYNGRYTYEREKLLKHFAMQDYLKDWKYTIRIKLYTAVRLWVIGIHKAVIDSGQPLPILKELIAPMTTGLTFLLGIIFIPLAWMKRRKTMQPLLTVLITVLYWWGIHLPFAIQSRYTIPVRLLLIALTAISIDALLQQRKQAEN